MNPKPDKPFPTTQKLFWVLLFLILALVADYGFKLAILWQEHSQLAQADIIQSQNASRQLGQAQEVEKKLQSLSMNLIELAKTNATARQIVQDFRIQWTPAPQTPPVSASPILNRRTNP